MSHADYRTTELWTDQINDRIHEKNMKSCSSKYDSNTDSAKKTSRQTSTREELWNWQLYMSINQELKDWSLKQETELSASR